MKAKWPEFMHRKEEQILLNGYIKSLINKNILFFSFYLSFSSSIFSSSFSSFPCTCTVLLSPPFPLSFSFAPLPLLPLLSSSSHLPFSPLHFLFILPSSLSSFSPFSLPLLFSLSFLSFPLFLCFLSFSFLFLLFLFSFFLFSSSLSHPHLPLSTPSSSAPITDVSQGWWRRMRRLWGLLHRYPRHAQQPDSPGTLSSSFIRDQHIVKSVIISCEHICRANHSWRGTYKFVHTPLHSAAISLM